VHPPCVDASPSRVCAPLVQAIYVAMLGSPDRDLQAQAARGLVRLAATSPVARAHAGAVGAVPALLKLLHVVHRRHHPSSPSSPSSSRHVQSPSFPTAPGSAAGGAALSPLRSAGGSPPGYPNPLQQLEDGGSPEREEERMEARLRVSIPDLDEGRPATPSEALAQQQQVADDLRSAPATLAATSPEVTWLATDAMGLSPWVDSVSASELQEVVLMALFNLSLDTTNQVRIVKAGVFTLLRIRMADAASQV
jgi:hypothetical protein